MLFCGMLPMIISHFIVLPYAGPTPLMQNDTASLQSNFPYEKKKRKPTNQINLGCVFHRFLERVVGLPRVHEAVGKHDMDFRR